MSVTTIRVGLEIKITCLNFHSYFSNSLFHFSQRLTGKSPDSLEELREIAFDAEDEEEHEEEDKEQHRDESEADECQDSVELSTEQSHDHDVPHKDDSTANES